MYTGISSCILLSVDTGIFKAIFSFKISVGNIKKYNTIIYIYIFL